MASSDLIVYLCGGISKGGRDKEKVSHDQDNIDSFVRHLESRRPILLSPAIRHDDLSNPLSVFGRDLLQVMLSDIILVDAREKRGIGVGAEMLFSHTSGPKVISITPPESHYRRSHTTILNVQIRPWIHPFVSTLSDFVVENYKQAAVAADSLPHREFAIPALPSKVKEAIKEYLKTQLLHDKAMKDAVNNSQLLGSRLLSIDRGLQ